MTLLQGLTGVTTPGYTGQLVEPPKVARSGAAAGRGTFDVITRAQSVLRQAGGG
jgi:hypothetical protein